MVNVSLFCLVSKLRTPIVMIIVLQIINTPCYYAITTQREFPNSRWKSSLLVLVGKCGQFVLHFYLNSFHYTLVVPDPESGIPCTACSSINIVNIPCVCYRFTKPNLLVIGFIVIGIDASLSRHSVV